LLELVPAVTPDGVAVLTGGLFILIRPVLGVVVVLFAIPRSEARKRYPGGTTRWTWVVKVVWVAWEVSVVWVGDQ